MPYRRNNKTDAVPLLLLLLLLLLLPAVVSPRVDHCDPTRLPPRTALNPDQITVIINGYSETRIPLLKSIVSSYASSSSLVSSILVLWANPSTPAHIQAHLAQTLSSLSSPSLPVLFLPQPSSSLNSRFLPRPEIKTRAVLICDDDVHVDSPSLYFAFKTWSSNPDRLIGLFARSHGLDFDERRLVMRWVYTVHPHRYSIILTKFMILKTEYLFEYTCGRRRGMVEMRRMVEEENNCEDILMNFVVGDMVNGGPILVGAHEVRDWGDGRNEEGGGVRDVGLSGRGHGEHRKRRGECIGEFHRVLGRMPLRYSYGKVVDDVGEQGLCSKGGKLVPCDEF